MKIPKTCCQCNQKVKRKQALPFEGEAGSVKVYCLKCYMSLAPEAKLKMVCRDDLVKVSLKATGFLVGGLAGGIGYSGGYKAGFKWAVTRQMKKHNFTQRDLDKKAIEVYNTHFWLCPEEMQNEALKFFKMTARIKKEKDNESTQS